MESPEMIDAWLKTATRDLCDAAKERIALEIKAHFNDAVAAHEADGKPLAKAQLLALEELGDATEAGKRFKKKYLTVRQYKFIEYQKSLVTKKHPQRSLFFISLMACAIWGVLFYFKLFTLVDISVLIAFTIIQISTSVYDARLIRLLPFKIAIRRICKITIFISFHAGGAYSSISDFFRFQSNLHPHFSSDAAFYVPANLQ
jgi:hypothetical protein